MNLLILFPPINRWAINDRPFHGLETQAPFDLILSGLGGLIVKEQEDHLKNHSKPMKPAALGGGHAESYGDGVDLVVVRP